MFGGTVGVPLVIRAPGGAGAQLTAQHSQSLEAWFAGCPGLKVVAPASVADAYGMLKTSIRDDDPVLFCENLVMYNVTGSLPDEPEALVPLGEAAVVREGEDLTIVAHSYTVQRALRVADNLSRDGVEAEVVDRIHDLCFDDLDAPVVRVGQAEVPMPYSKPLELAALPVEAKIEAAARRLLQECGVL